MVFVVKTVATARKSAASIISPDSFPSANPSLHAALTLPQAYSTCVTVAFSPTGPISVSILPVCCPARTRHDVFVCKFVRL